MKKKEVQCTQGPPQKHIKKKKKKKKRKKEKTPKDINKAPNRGVRFESN